MTESGLRRSRPSIPLPRRLAALLVLLVPVLCASGRPAFADTATPSSPSTSGRAYTPAIIRVQVPDLRQQVLAEAQKIAADSHLRVQVSGDAAVDPAKVIVVRQTPDPNTSAAVGSVITVVVQAPNTSQPPPSRAVVVPSRLTSVPDLLRKSLMEARPLVENARLRLEVSGGAPEDTSHAIVVSQNPAAGTRAVVGSAVTVSVRLETAERVVVPELRPRSLADAQRLAASARLKLEVSGDVPGDSSRATVATQKPPAGARVPVNTPVVVTLQAPPRTEELATVPDVRRQPLLDAQQRINRAKLRLEVSGGWPASPQSALVVEQKPAPESRVPFDSTVVVSVRSPISPPSGPPPSPTPPGGVVPPRVVPPVEPPPAEQWVLVPDVRRRPLMDGVQRARAARLRLEVSGGWPSAPERAVVYEQQPAPETRVRIGSTLTVQITPPQVATPPPVAPPPSSPPPSTPPPSPPPPRVTPPRPELVLVPDLRQQPLPEARQLTLSARLELRVRGQVPADETRALVVSQRPEPGTRVAVRSAVLAELGPAMLAVPDLRTRPLDEARRLVSQAGFELAIMGEAPSNESRAKIIEQAPQPGARAQAGSTVTVRAKTSRVTTWVMAGAGALLAAAGAAFGVARWRGISAQSATGLPGVRVVAASDVGKQEIHANGTAAEGVALRLRSRIDGGTQTVEDTGRLVTEARRING